MEGRVGPHAARVVEHLGQAREERRRFALVHVLGAVQDDDVVVKHDLQRHHHFLILFCEIAEHELHLHFSALPGLRAVHEAQEVSS